MEIEILSPTEQIFAGTVKQVNLPGANGSFEILENHAPIISILTQGEVRIVDSQGQHRTFTITGGVVEQSNHKVLLLVD
ncbi:MAG: ATP synthase F1 subunit epsilon [Bacteroidales bacterium]|jgi:F-type H+-transporting ATPase subunit epsilon|nr:ATP synthase F1 subunit epsilon [Bacteroidales bacterium]